MLQLYQVGPMGIGVSSLKDIDGSLVYCTQDQAEREVLNLFSQAYAEKWARFTTWDIILKIFGKVASVDCTLTAGRRRFFS